VKLAFYWANGFLVDSFGNKEEDFFGQMIIDERVSLDIEDFPLDNEPGYSLIQTYYVHDLGALFSHLHKPEIEARSEKPWEELV